MPLSTVICSVARLVPAASVAALLCLAGVPAALGQTGEIGDRFTYQGQLVENGEPVDGSYDFIVSIFDAPTGGTSQAFATFQNVTIENGLFTLDIDPTPIDPFASGGPRWLDISLRPSGTVDYEVLTPRQRVNAVPFARTAVSSATQALVRPAGAASIATTVGDADRVLINRQNPISGAEYFGVRAPVTGSSFGGMYIETDGAEAFPFYGYSRAGTITAFTYIRGAPATPAFGLNFNTFTDVFEVDFQGNVVAAGDITSRMDMEADAYTYPEPQLRRVTVSAAGFRPARANRSFGFRFDEYSLTGDTSLDTTFIAPLTLPDGAVLEAITVTAFDLSSERDISATVLRSFLDAGNADSLFGVSTTGTPGYNRFRNGQSTQPIENRTIDNENYAYTLTVRAINDPTNFNDTWTSSLRFKGVTIEYTVEEAD